MSAFPDERLPVPGAHAILQNRNIQDEEGVEAHKVFTSGGPLGLVQHSKTRPFAPSLGRVIAAILTSLAAAYLVLRCFQGIAEGYRQHEATRALSAGGYDSEDQKCTSEGRGGIPQNPSYLEGEEPAYGAMYLAADDENDDEIDLSVAGEAFEELWKNRNLPPQAERIFAHYLARIVSTASLCVELKTKLKREDYFIMVNRVGKILATQLGLLSLNPPSLEPCRVRAGMALLELLSTTKVSQHDTEDVRYIGRQNRSLETLVKAIMSPRLDSAEMTGRHHQKRVVGIFRLVRAINGHMMGCISTLRYLINYPGSTLPEGEIRRQLKLLQILFETQRARCLLDSTTFWFLLCCQRNLSQFLLFSRRLAFQYCGKPISPFKEFEARLNETIESAGGTAYIPLEQDAKKEGFPGAPTRTDGPDSPSQAAADGAGAVVDAGDVADGAGAVGGDADAVFDGGAGAVFDGGAGAVFDGGAGAVYDDDGVASYPHTAFGAEQSSQMFTAGPSRTAENYAEQTTGSQWVSPRRSSTGMAAPMTTRRSFIGGHPSAAGVRGHTQQWPRHPHAAAFPTYQHPAEPAHFPEPYRGRATSYATWSPGDDRDLRELPPRFARGHDRGSKAFEEGGSSFYPPAASEQFHAEIPRMGQSQSGFPTASPSGLYPWRGDDSIWRSGEQMYSASHASQTWEYTPKEPSGRHAGVSHSVESASWEHPAGGALASQSSIDFRDSRDVRQPLQQPRPRPPPPPGFERLYPESSHTQAAAAPVRSARGPEPYPFSTLQPREAGGRAGSHFDPFRGGLHAGPDSQPLSPLSHPFPKSSFDPAAIPSSPLLASLADGIWTPNAGATSSSHGFSAGRGGTRMPSLPPPLGSTSGWHQTQRGIAQQGRRQQNDGEDVLDALEEAIEQLRVQSNSEGDNPDGI